MDTTHPIDCEPSIPCFFDDSDETLVPPRSPSRLDFCIEELGDGDGSESHRVDWASTFHGDCPYTLIDEDTFPVDIAPPDCLRVAVPKSFETKSIEDEDMDEILIEPRAPIPIRPPSVQLQVDAQEYPSPIHTTSQRLNYPHHGLSRSALLQQKTFWSSRQEEWLEWQSRTAQKQDTTTNDAYTGLATAKPHAVENPPPYMRTPSSGMERDLADRPTRTREQDVHATIYPRAGDISALRDPYSVNVDRCFFRLPLWTLNKILYMFNLHQASGPSPSASVSSIQASDSSSTLSSYSSSNSGEDDESDHTLVADDSPATKSRLTLELSKCATSLPSLHLWNSFWGWSWYARWEVLIDLFQWDLTKRDVLDMSMKLAGPSKAAPPSPPSPIFHFAVEEDDDDDYGTIITTSTFNVDFEKECERAMAFYNRESRKLGRTTVTL